MRELFFEIVCLNLSMNRTDNDSAEFSRQNLLRI